MTIHDRILEILTKNRLMQKDLAAYVGLSTSTLGNWLKHRKSIPAEHIPPICEFLKVDLQWLLTGKTEQKKLVLDTNAQALLKNYKSLDSNAQLTLLGASFQLMPPLLEGVNTVVPFKQISKDQTHDDELEGETSEYTVYPYRASAGLGFFNYDDLETETVRLPVHEVPRNADNGIWVEGKSMEPQIKDGSIAWIRLQPTIENGEIGIFYYNEELYCKKFHRDNRGQITLISVNENFNDMEIVASEELENFRVVGKVVGSTDYEQYI